MNELLMQIIFYVFAALAVFSALMVVSQNNPVRCVLFLVLTFFASAALWLMAYAEFLSLILILVYVGAVMTLFLFVVMMLNIDVEMLKNNARRYFPFGLLIVAFLTGLLIKSLPFNFLQQDASGKQLVEQAMNSQQMNAITHTVSVASTPAVSNTEALGLVLYTDYFLAFEIAAVILLVAIVSAITLVHRGAIRSKRQDIVKQIMTRSTDRVELVSMKSEK